MATIPRLTDSPLSGVTHAPLTGVGRFSLFVVISHTAIQTFICWPFHLLEYFLGLESQKWDSRVKE